MSNRDYNLMQRAFSEAAKSNWLFTAPNPLVGALALQNGHVLGYGHHAQFGQEHAEEMALQSHPAADELFVTLEPCSSSNPAKKRGACVDLILASGVKRVVVGAIDPDSRHAGAGINKLHDSNIEVVVLDCEQQFTEQNPAFLQHLQRDVPFTIAKWAATADGFIAASGGQSQWISNQISRAEVHHLRGASQAIAAASGTVVADNPRLTARDVQHSVLRTKVLVGCADKVQSDANLFKDDMQRIWLDSTHQQPDWSTSNDRFSCFASESSNVDLLSSWRHLCSEHNINRIFVEAGPRFLHSLVACGLVHALVKYEAPLLLGGGISAVAGSGAASPEQALALTNELRCSHGNDLRRAWLVD